MALKEYKTQSIRLSYTPINGMWDYHVIFYLVNGQWKVYVERDDRPDAEFINQFPAKLPATPNFYLIGQTVIEKYFEDHENY